MIFVGALKKEKNWIGRAKMTTFMSTKRPPIDINKIIN